MSRESAGVGPVIQSHDGRSPRLQETVFVAPTAVIIGNVEIAEGGSVWYGAVLREDICPIRIGLGRMFSMALSWMVMKGNVFQS